MELVRSVPRRLVVSRSVGDVVTPLGWDIEMLEEGCVATMIASWFADGLNWLNGGGCGCGCMTYPKCILLSEDIEDCGDSKDGLVVLDQAV